MITKGLVVFVAVISLGQCALPGPPITTTTETPPTAPPPQPSQIAKMARYIMRNSDWVSIATRSTQDDIAGYPFVTLKSVSDGLSTNSTGIPYLYMTDMDVSGKDLLSDNRCTMMATLAESDYCKQQKFDPQDPRCAKLIITGRLIRVKVNSSEYQFGKAALYEKHPSMQWWPKDHDFYVAKIDIEQIEVLDYFGGIKHVTIPDYFNADSTEAPVRYDLFFEKIEVIKVNA